MPELDATQIKLHLVGEGEGFKRAVIYDPEGNVAGSMEAFIDLGDKARHQYSVSAVIPERFRNRIWGIELQEVSADRIEGVLPYYSTSRNSFFKN